MGRSVVVTGATSGFGEAIARSFLAAGDRVFGTGRREERLRALADELGPRFVPLPFDLQDPTATAEALAEVPEVDVLVNNAGLALGIGRVPEADLADWETMIATNCAALARVTRLVTPGMVARGRGHVVNLGSIASTHAYPGGNVYGATKAFVRQFSANLRTDLHGSGIRVTLIEPAAARTEFSEVRFKGDQARAEAIYQGFEPLTAEDIARAVQWATDQPPHMNVALIELWPTAQSPGGPQYHRRPTGT